MKNTTTMLVVDKDPGVVHMVDRVFTQDGYIVLGASNAAEAMHHVNEREVDIVLLERTLPDMSGIDLCQAIKTHYNGLFVPVIMITARSKTDDKVQGLDAGADDYIPKPFEISELMARVRVMLRIRAKKSPYEPFDRVLRGRLRETYTDSDQSAVTLHFDFPQEVMTPCKQYLLYFSEFLHDLGIDATTAIQDDLRGVLFSVTPKDKEEALDNIREALEIYLRLPGNRSVTSIITPETSIEVQRLQAQIYHFQSQIMLANATLQQKELIIQQQQGLIQQQLLSGQVLIQSLHKEEQMEEEAEPIVGDIVKVKRWEWEAFEVDLPTLLRRLKEKFGRV